MMKILETSRLVLREFHLSDAEKMWKLNNDPKVLKYTGDVSFDTIDAALLFLQNYNDYQKNGFGRWAVVLKSSNEFIGWCGLKRNEDSMVDIGFRFFKKYWNKGYASESAKACLYYGFNNLKLTEIIGRASEYNEASIKVLEKIGMNYWKTEFYEGLGSTKIYILHAKQIRSNS